MSERNATNREIDQAMQAGKVASQASRMRAPALDETIRALIADAQPGEKRPLDIMQAFTRGYDAETTAELENL